MLILVRSKKNSMKIDDIDKLIIELLSENSKQGIKEIAEQIGLTVSPTYERIKRLERENIITGYTIEVNKTLLGKNFQVLCSVSLKEHNAELIHVFENKVVALKEVSMCYHIAGDYDYVLMVEVADIQEYEHFLKKKLATIPDIANVQSSIIMSTIKDD